MYPDARTGTAAVRRDAKPVSVEVLGRRREFATVNPYLQPGDFRAGSPKLSL